MRWSRCSHYRLDSNSYSTEFYRHSYPWLRTQISLSISSSDLWSLNIDLQNTERSALSRAQNRLYPHTFSVRTSSTRIFSSKAWSHWPWLSQVFWRSKSKMFIQKDIWNDCRARYKTAFKEYLGTLCWFLRCTSALSLCENSKSHLFS